MGAGLMGGKVESDCSAQGPQTCPSSEELLKLIVESATDFAIVAIDPGGTVISWNSGAERLLGYASDEILGRSADTIFTPEDCAAGIPQDERTRAAAHGRAKDERWHVRKDGSRFWGSGLLMPLADPAVGFVKIFRDRTRRRNAEAALRVSEERFRHLATNIPQLVFRSRGNGARTWGSPQWETYSGLSDAASRDLGWLDAVHPEDVEPTLAAWREAQQTNEYFVEHRIRRAADGEYRWHHTRAKPVSGNGSGEIEWVGTSTDVHDLRDLQDKQQLFLAELQHRTRNLLAVVQSVQRQTLHKSSSLEDFSIQFESRLGTLSRVQSLLADTDYDNVDLRSIVEAELNAYSEAGDHGDGKVSLDGPPVSLHANSAQALALALHELATNAVKYGAFSQPQAHLTVSWRLEDRNDRNYLLLDWRESNVRMPDPQEPRRKGYGSELIESALPYQLKARTKLEFMPDGVHCFIEVTTGVAGRENVRG